METSSITNLRLSLHFYAPIEKYQAACIKRIVQCHSIHDFILQGDFSINLFSSILKALSRNSTIQNLKICFSNLHVGRKAVATIAKSLRSKKISLKSLDLSANRIGNDGCCAVMKALRNYPSLKALDVSDCCIDTEGAIVIGQLLRSSQCAISELKISGNCIGNEGCAAVMAGLLENSSVRVLGMRECRIGKEGAEVIASALCSGKCAIEELELHQNSAIKDEGCVVIMEALINNNSICKLNLSNCRIGDVGIKGISKVLQNNHAACLRTLSLSHNQNIGAEGFKALAIALSQNSSLEDLDLSCCNFSFCDDGCYDLMNALSQNSSLKVINLDDCEIGNEGGKSIANFLKSNVGSIHDLNLDSNSLDEESLIEIAHSLHFNTHLTKLILGYVKCRPTEKVWIALDGALFCNHSLQELDLLVCGYKFEHYKKSIEKNLDLNKKLGPVKAEMVKTGLFPHHILPCLTTSPCFVDALSKVASLHCLSPVFDLVCEWPMLCDMDDCVCC